MNSALDELMKSLKSKYFSSDGPLYAWREQSIESQTEQNKTASCEKVRISFVNHVREVGKCFIPIRKSIQVTGGKCYFLYRKGLN